MVQIPPMREWRTFRSEIPVLGNVPGTCYKELRRFLISEALVFATDLGTSYEDLEDIPKISERSDPSIDSIN